MHIYIYIHTCVYIYMHLGLRFIIIIIIIVIKHEPFIIDILHGCRSRPSSEAAYCSQSWLEATTRVAAAGVERRARRDPGGIV